MAKEVKLFDLSDFLVGRLLQLSDEFYEAINGSPCGGTSSPRCS